MKETIDVTPAELESLVMSKRRRDYILYVLRNFSFSDLFFNKTCAI